MFFREKKSVGRSVDGSVGYIHTRASSGLVVNHYAVAMSPKGKKGKSPTVLELVVEICFSGRQTIMIVANHADDSHVVDIQIVATLPR